METKKLLATAVRLRRFDLGFETAAELAEVSNLSPRTINDVENGNRESYRDKTLWALDDALLWERGSAKNLLENGVQPTLKTLTTIAGNAGCDVMTGFIEHQELQAILESGSLAGMTPKQKIVALAEIFGLNVNDYDLLTELDIMAVVSTVKTAFTSEVLTRQSMKPEYGTQPLPVGFTRLQIDWAYQQAENQGNENITFPELVNTYLAPQASDNVENNKPNFYQLAAHDDPTPIYGETNEYGSLDTIGEHTQENYWEE